MAVQIISSAETDGVIASYGSTNWATERDATTGNNVFEDAEDVNLAIAGEFQAGRGGGTWNVRRSFFAFDTSTISSSFSVSDVELTVTGEDATGYVSGSIMVVKAVKPDLLTDITTSNMAAITGYSAGNSMAGNVTDYVDSFYPSGSWSDSGANTITLNATARADVKSLDVFKLALVNYRYDYLNVDPNDGNPSEANGLKFAETSYEPHRPSIRVTYTEGYGNKVCGVGAQKVGKIAGIASANVDKVLGADD